MELFTFLVSTILAGLICSVPGYAIGKLLVRNGMVYDRSWGVVVGSVVVLLIWRLAFPATTWVWQLLGITVLMPIGIYRNDLWTYWRKAKLP
jgi:hypothetical protein